MQIVKRKEMTDMNIESDKIENIHNKNQWIQKFFSLKRWVKFLNFYSD